MPTEALTLETQKITYEINYQLALRARDLFMLHGPQSEEIEFMIPIADFVSSPLIVLLPKKEHDAEFLLQIKNWVAQLGVQLKETNSSYRADLKLSDMPVSILIKKALN